MTKEMEQQQKDLVLELKTRVKESLKRNRKRLLKPVVHSLGWMFGIYLVLIVLLFVSTIVNARYFHNEEVFQWTLRIFPILGYSSVTICAIVGTYQYWKVSSALINTERIKFFLLKWTGDQSEKLDEIGNKHKDNESTTAALQEFRNWLEEEVAKMMAIESQ